MTEFQIFKYQVQALTVANLKARYRQTIAGFVWVVLNPLLMFGVQSLVFRKFLRLQVPDYSIFLLSGLLPWIFILQSLEMSTSIFVTNGRLIKSFPINPLVCLFAQLCDNVVNFLAAFLIILIPVWMMHPGNIVGFLLLPLALVALFGAVVGMAWLLATLQVFFRDTRFLVTFMMSFTFFLTPVFYPAEYVPQNFRWLIIINPFHHLLVPFRISLHSFDFWILVRSLGLAFAIAAGFLATAALFWRARRNAVYFNV